MIKIFSAAIALTFVVTPCFADEPDGLVLPPGFHATVVAEGVGPARHLAVRSNGDIYISTRRGKDEKSNGMIALRLGPDHRAVQIENFSDVNGGTGIRFDHGKLYASSPTAIYRFTFPDSELVPGAPPQLVIEGMPTGGFANRPLAFDGKGNLFVSVGGSGNLCTDQNVPKGIKPIGLKPCPSLTGRSGIWRFRAATTDQHFPGDGEQLATGVRDIDALDFSSGRNALYAVAHDRNGTHQGWPDIVSLADEDAIAEEMHHIVKGTDLGWPYTYYDSTRKIRLVAPEYGGDGKIEAPTGLYSAPLFTFPAHGAPLDMVFYDGKQFPAKYRGGAFVAFHGGSGPHLAAGHPGYNIMFVPIDRKGAIGTPELFADGFAGIAPDARNADNARYRPVGVAVAPDGALYVAESQKGRIWRISYGG
jgi:glucose/arabinose dehydrogenase